MRQLELPIIITVLFFAMKLMGVIAWSWWWVFSPLWIVFLAAFVMLALMAYAEARNG